MRFQAFLMGGLLCWGELFAQSSQLRFMAIAVKGEPPTVEEAKQFARGEKTLEGFVSSWLVAPGHQVRIHRYFEDMFGVTGDLFILSSNLVLEQTPEGAYYSPAKGSCAAAESQTVSAWWAESGMAQMCNNSLSDALTYQVDGDEINCMGDGIFNASCGCGPDQIICVPRAEYTAMRQQVREEFADRGFYAYETALSWKDLLGGDFLYGTRLLYWVYLQRQYLAPTGNPLTAALKQNLMAVPVRTKIQVAFPDTGVERAGLPTSPGFLMQHNNFRSRIRALTEKLLCRDVDGGLNTDGYSLFLNADFTDFDRSHGVKEGCASCHYAMDNLGSTLFGWNDQGFLQTNWGVIPSRPYLTTGYAFGLEGVGPRFLIDGYVERGPGFASCMAKTAWQGFTGGVWDDLSPEFQNELESQAVLGPQQLLRHLFSSKIFLEYRSGSTVIESDTTSQALDFSSQVLPIILQSCSGSSCHSSGTGLGATYDFTTETVFQQIPAVRLDDGTMPPAGSNKTLSVTDKQILLEFLAQ